MGNPGLPFQCRCGQLHGVVHDVGPRSVNRLVCYCKDCQTAARVLNDPETLDEHGGTDLFQTVPQKIEITAGQEHLACLRLSPSGVYRFYAGCCDSPLYTMLAANGVSFCGVNLSRVALEDRAQAGPVVGVYGSSGAIDPPPGFKNRGILRATVAVIWRSIGTRIRGEKNPFLGADGMPNVPVWKLTLDERNAARPD